MPQDFSPASSIPVAISQCYLIDQKPLFFNFCTRLDRVKMLLNVICEYVQSNN